MPSTQLDLSPIGNDRQQDISSWHEADIAGLTTRDLNRYNRRKAAVQEYFQTDLTIEEITTKHRLSSRDSLEKLAQRCLLLHEDGLLWGFRALVPGVTVTDHRSTTTDEQTQSTPAEVLSGQAADDTEMVSADPFTPGSEDEDDTAKRQVVLLARPMIKTPEDRQEAPSLAEVEDAADAPANAAEALAEEGASSPDTQREQKQEPEPVSQADASVVQAMPLAELETAELTTVVQQDQADALDDKDAPAQPTLSEIQTVTIQAVAPTASQQDEAIEPTASAGETGAAAAVAVIAQPQPDESRDTSTSSETTATEQTSLEEDTERSQEHLPIDARQTLALAAARQRNSRQLAAVRTLNQPIQSLVEESRYRLTGSQAVIRRSIYKRWNRINKKQRHQRAIKIMSAAIIVAILVILLIPLAVGLVGYNTYTNIKNVANDGLNNLMSIQALIPANKSDITSVLNAQKLAQAKTNLAKSQADFLQLQDMINRPDIQSLLQEFAPSYASELGQAGHLVQVALDITNMGQELIGVAQIATGIVHGGALLSSSSTTPLISADDINTIEATLVHAQYYISDIQTQMSQVNLAQLPFGSPAQKAKIAKYLPELATAQSAIAQAQSLIGPVSWLLGVGQARHFLVQTLDRGELRSSGGFEGQYGILTLTNGRMSPFTLRDVTLIDYDENGAELGNHPPAQYKWMDFGNFGVRDANLSADYPTTAQLVMKTFEQEGGGPLDGDIQITPVVIEQLLQLTGPITLSDYGQTVTASNLETLIHKYQQDYQFISQEEQVTGTDTHQTRKAFTSQLGQDLLARVKGLSISQLMSFGKILLTDLKSRDLQVYFTNPVAEQWLTQNGDSGAMPSLTNGVDGFMVVQSNISISKASQFVHSTFNDQVTLDAQGNAHHTLTVTLNYARNNNPVYGYNTYADYVRVYVPANAQLISSYGFDTGSVLCTPNSGKAPPKTSTSTSTTTTTTTTPTSTGGGSYIDDINGLNKVVYGCGEYYHYYPEEDYRDCSSTGNYELGYDGMVGTPWPIRNVGAASSTSSDLPGYKMWGGMTLTPPNCTTTLTFQWETPHEVQNTPGQSPYQMIVGHQAGWPDTMQVHIDASALKGVTSVTENETIDDDTLIALANRPLPPSPGKAPTPTPAATPTKPKH